MKVIDKRNRVRENINLRCGSVLKCKDAYSNTNHYLVALVLDAKYCLLTIEDNFNRYSDKEIPYGSLNTKAVGSIYGLKVIEVYTPNQIDIIIKEEK